MTSVVVVVYFFEGLVLLGYIKGNVVFVISAVNTMKNNLSEKEFLNIIESIYNKSLKI